MGCYGIGTGRTVAAAIEQSHDKDGIIWPKSIAPFDVLLIPLDTKNEKIMTFCNELYKKLGNTKREVLMDDRGERPGVKFKDADLIGIPYQIIVGPRDFEKGKAEIKARQGNQRIKCKTDDILDVLDNLFPCL